MPAQPGWLKTGQDGKGLLRTHLWCPDDLSMLWDRIEKNRIEGKLGEDQLTNMFVPVFFFVSFCGVGFKTLESTVNRFISLHLRKVNWSNDSSHPQVRDIIIMVPINPIYIYNRINKVKLC